MLICIQTCPVFSSNFDANATPDLLISRIWSYSSQHAPEYQPGVMYVLEF